MKIDEQKKQKQQVDRKKSPKKEQLSRKDIDELMGTNRQTYTRRHGAVRNK